MSWQIFILISVFLYSITVLLQRLISTSKESDPQATAIVYQLMTGVTIGAVGLVTGELIWPKLSDIGLIFVLTVILYAGANVFLFKALEKVEASMFSIIFSSKAIVTLIVAYLFLAERLSTPNMIGTLMILSGVVIVNLKSSKIEISQGEQWAGLAAIGYGIANVMDRVLLSSLELYGYVSLMFVLPALLLLVRNPQDRTIIGKIKKYFKPKMFRQTALMSAIYALAAITFFKALQIADTASQVTTINTSSVVLTVLLAAIFLKERTNLPKKILASLITFVGLYLVSH